jgi:hypothetical protein
VKYKKKYEENHTLAQDSQITQITQNQPSGQPLMPST